MTEPLLSESSSPDEALAELLATLMEPARAGDLDQEELIAAHPQFAEQLRAYLPLMKEMCQLQGGHSESGRVIDSLQDVYPPGRLGDYQIVRELGRGGMGVVYEAEQVSLGRRVAIKILPQASTLDSRQLARFRVEVQAIALLQHPNIVSIYSVGHEQGIHYYAMQYVDGESLAVIIAHLAHAVAPNSRGPTCDESSLNARKSVEAVMAGAQLSLHSSTHSHHHRQIAHLMMQAAEALHHAHSRGVKHRDIKPSNLIIDTSGNVWISDFGLAKLDSDTNVTLTGDMPGTLRYMSPEQASSGRMVVDHRSDIYSLGATFYELLTLRPAHPAEGRHELLQQVISHDPVAPRRINRSIPAELEYIIRKSIEKDPTDRYASAQDLATDLRRFLDCRPILAQPRSLHKQIIKWFRRHVAIALAVICVLGAVVLCLSTSTFLISRSLASARVSRADAVRERDSARHERDAARYNVYVAEIRLGQSEWQQGHISTVLKSLNHHLPAPGEVDLRGWEWHYLNSLCHKDQLTINAHINGALSVAWSPNGTLIASGGDDAVIRVWNAKTGRLLATLRGHHGPVSGLTWSPDSLHLASSSDDTAIRIWTMDAPQAIRTLEVDGAVHSLYWDPQGDRISAVVNLGSQTNVRIWNLESGDQILDFTGEGDAMSASWSPDGKQLAVGRNFRNCDIHVWDIDSRSLAHRITGAHEHGICAISWSPDGKTLASGSYDQCVKLWNTSNWQSVHSCQAHHGTIQSLAWDPSGDILASGGEDAKIVLWERDTGKEIRTLRGHHSGVFEVHWSATGAHLASASRDGTIKVWDPTRDQANLTLDGYGFAWSEDGERLAQVQKNDLTSDSPFPITVKFLHGWTGRESGRLSLNLELDGVTGYSATWSPNSQRVAVAANGKDAAVVCIVDPSAGREILRFSIAAPAAYSPPKVDWVRAVAWSGDASMLVTGGTDGHLRTWNAGTGALEKDIDAHSDQIGSIVISPDGTQLASASWDQRVKVWNTETWRETLHLNRDPSGSTRGADGHSSIAWHPNGGRLAGVGTNGWAYIWDSYTGETVLSFHAHTNTIRAVDWSPDGRRLATGGEDGNIRIWDAATGSELLLLRHGARIYRLAWSSDGHRVMASSGATCRVWDARPSGE